MGNQHSRVSQEDEKTTHALTWMQPDRHGLAPSPRNGHTADMIEGKLYIFGGGDKAELLNELFVFDTHDHQWSQPPCTGIAPPPRSRHTSGVVDQRLLIWGGIGGGLDVHVLDTQTLAWSTPTAHGDVPESRFGHTSSTISPQDDARLLILGGHNSRAALSDAHVLMVETMTWVEPTVGGVARHTLNLTLTLFLTRRAADEVGRAADARRGARLSLAPLCRAPGPGGLPTVRRRGRHAMPTEARLAFATRTTGAH